MINIADMLKSYVGSHGRPVRCALAAGFFCLALALSVSGAAWAGSPVVAEVNGRPVTEMDVDEAVQRLVPSAIFHGGITPEKRLKYRPQAIAQVIDEELLAQHAEALGLKASDKSIEELKEGTKESLGGSKAYKAALKEAGLSESQYEARLRKNILVQEALRVAVEEPSRMSEEDLKQFYETNKASFKRPEARVVRHILIKVDPASTDAERKALRDKAEGLLDSIKKGADFSQVAWDNSNDAYSVKGGLLGLVHKGMLDKALEDEVWKLQAGQLSDIIQTIYGYHIVKVEEVRAPEQLPYEAVRESIKTSQEKKSIKKLKDELLAKLRAEAKVVMVDKEGGKQ